MEKRDNSGALFKAKENENPKWPGYEGSALIDGKEYWLSAWVKEGQNGKFFSLAFKPKEAKRADKPSVAKYADDGEPLPF